MFPNTTQTTSSSCHPTRSVDLMPDSRQVLTGSDLPRIAPILNPTINADSQHVETHLRGIMNPDEERRLNRLIEGSARASFSIDSLSINAGNSGVFRYFDSGDDWSFLDGSSLGAPSSNDFNKLLEDITTAMKRVLFPEYFFPQERQLLTEQSNVNENFNRTFSGNNLIHGIRLGGQVLTVRREYAKINFALRIILGITTLLTLVGKVVNRPILYKSSAVLTTITTLFMGSAYYRYLMDEETAVFNLRCHLDGALISST